jgi:chromosome segregation ATPase
MELFFLKK